MKTWKKPLATLIWGATCFCSGAWMGFGTNIPMPEAPAISITRVCDELVETQDLLAASQQREAELRSELTVCAVARANCTIERGEALLEHSKQRRSTRDATE